MNILGTSDFSNKQPLLQTETMSPFWEIKVLLVETNPSVIRMVEKVLEETSVLHFLRRIDNVHDLNFELKYNKPNVIVCGRTMENFDALVVLDQVKLFAPNIPVLVMAPDFNAPLNIKLVNEGAYDIIYHSEIKRLPKEVSFLYKAVLQNIA
jgi:DNA-binding NtrC family response regulator